MNSQDLQAIIQPDGSLAVVPGGPVTITVTVSIGPDSCKTAVIAFGGYNQAIVSFDSMGTTPISYMLFNPMPTLALDTSVKNILSAVLKS